MDQEPLIKPHGGYQGLRAFQMAEIVYDGTVAFTRLYLDGKSRTVDQMVQAARSGRQNIAEGSVASGTSSKIELKLIGIARASQEELLLDYRDFLRQNDLAEWPKDHERSSSESFATGRIGRIGPKRPMSRRRAQRTLRTR